MLSLLSIFVLLSSSITPALAAWGQTIRDDNGTLTGGGEAAHQDAYYHKLILVHGIFAALVFLLLIPVSIITARYFKTRSVFSNGKWLRVHMILNITSVLFITITFVTGYYAVGTQGNVFDNVHHRIGTTIYVAIILQALFGLLNAYVLYRPHVRTPIQNKLHVVFGWLLWGLAIANIAVGMVLYGSPQYLFILYAVAAGLWLLVLLGLEAAIGEAKNHVKRDDYMKINWNGQVVGDMKQEMGNSPSNGMLNGSV